MNSVTTKVILITLIVLFLNATAYTQTATVESLTQVNSSAGAWAAADQSKFATAGTRGNARVPREAIKLWRQVPEIVRNQGPEATAEFLNGKDASHIRAHSRGGSNKASNIVWEDAGKNRARGSRHMTRSEVRAARSSLRTDAVMFTVKRLAMQSISAGLITAGVVGILTSLEYGLDYAEGRITREQMIEGIAKEMAIALVAGAVFYSIAAGLSIAFPPLAPVIASISIVLAVFGLAVMTYSAYHAVQGWWNYLKADNPVVQTFIDEKQGVTGLRSESGSVWYRMWIHLYHLGYEVRILAKTVWEKSSNYMKDKWNDVKTLWNNWSN